MKRLRLGIVGSGFGLYGLLPAFHSLRNCQVVSICGHKNSRLLEFCKGINLNNIYEDWQDMLAQEQLDAIALAVPPLIQYQIACIAIKKGLHIFAEKPLTVTLLQARELYKLAVKNKITSAVDFIFPEIDEWRKIKEFLDSKKYGKLNYIAVNWDFLSYDIKHKKSSWKTDVGKGGGALSFFFSHVLYYLEYFAGEISTISSLLSYSKESINGGEVGIDLLLTFKEGIKGYTHGRCDTQGLWRHQIYFYCEKATISLRNENSVVNNFKIEIFTEEKGKQLLTKKKPELITDEDERVKEVRKIATRFVDACLEKKQMTPSIEHGLRVQELIEKIRRG